MRKFNPKQASEGFLGELGPVEGLEGFQVFDHSVLDNLSSGNDVQSGGKHEHYSPTPVKNPAPGAVLHTPSEWAQKVKEDATKPKSTGWKSDYIRQNLVNKRFIAGGLAAIDRLYRGSKHQCKTCGGHKYSYDASKPVEEQKICPECWGRGHTMGNPERSIMDRAGYAEKRNKMVSFHETHCGVNQCNPFCAFKSVIDEHVRKPSKVAKKDLKVSDVKLRSNSKNPLIQSMLRPEIVEDNYKPPAPILQIMGGREDEPLRKYDIGIHIGHDTNNPDSDTNKIDEGFHRFQETYETPKPGAVPLKARPNCANCSGKGCRECNGTGKQPDVDTSSGAVSWGKTWVDQEGKERQNSARPKGICAVCGKAKNDINHTAKQFTTHVEEAYGQGPRDKAAYTIIRNANAEGTRGDRFTFYTPIELQRNERNERLDNGGHPERGISLDTADMFDKDPDLYEKDPEGKELKEHTANIFGDLSHLIGERSPVPIKRMTFERDVPLTDVARGSAVTLPMYATAGTMSVMEPKKSILGRIPGARRLTEKTKDQKVRVNKTVRTPTYLDQESLRSPENFTSNVEALAEWDKFTKELHEDYTKLQRNNPKLPKPEDVTLTRSIKGRETTPRLQGPETKALPKREKKFNENVLGDLGPKTIEQPDEVPYELDTDEHKNNSISTFESDIGRKLNGEERKKAIEGIRNENHIDGAFKALGMKTPDEQEEEENQ